MTVRLEIPNTVWDREVGTLVLKNYFDLKPIRWMSLPKNEEDVLVSIL